MARVCLVLAVLVCACAHHARGGVAASPAADPPAETSRAQRQLHLPINDNYTSPSSRRVLSR
jgi:hypothetical protein